MGRIFRELLVMGGFLWCIALLCPMDRAFLARLLIVSEDSLIVSVDNLIVLDGGIRGREGVIILSKKNTVFLLRGGQGTRIRRILRIERIFFFYYSFPFAQNSQTPTKLKKIRKIRLIRKIRIPFPLLPQKKSSNSHSLSTSKKIKNFVVAKFKAIFARCIKYSLADAREMRMRAKA